MKRFDKAAAVLYEGQAYRITETFEFARWLRALRDRQARSRIIDRLKRASDGNFGDVKGVGGGVSEMRIDHGPGYRVYFDRRGNELVILLCGGDKRTQAKDIVRAQKLKAELDRGIGNETV